MGIIKQTLAKRAAMQNHENNSTVPISDFNPYIKHNIRTKWQLLLTASEGQFLVYSISFDIRILELLVNSITFEWDSVKSLQTLSCS